MTAYPVPDNANCWWLTTRATWKHLHAVPGDVVTPEQHQEAIDEGEPLTRTAVCGRTLDLAYPGISSRFGMPRCRDCCRVLGIPAGDGTPCNEQGLAARAETQQMEDLPTGGLL